MWAGTRCCRYFLKNGLTFNILKHDFMSDAFKCEEAWNHRLKSSLLQKVDLEDMFFEIDNKFNQKKKISAVDVDIFVNAVNSSSHLDEMEDVVCRLRLSSEATNIFPSTHHAFIRAYLKYGSTNELMRILDDRLNYGIFPDDFCYILLLDHFIKKEDYKNASKVAVLQMLQEDFSNALSTYLSLYSCCKYLLNPTDWDEIKEEVIKDDGEEVKVRVKYLRNPYFDNHFDLKEPSSLLGKTFIMISEHIDSSIKGDTLFIGYSLLKDWKQTKLFVNKALENNYSLSQVTVNIVEDIFSKESSEEVVNDEFFQDSLNGLKMLKNLSGNRDLVDEIRNKIDQEILKSEAMAEEQKKVYKDWLNNRDTALHEEIEKLNKIKILEAIKKKKQELIEKEQELYFFDRENEIDLEIEKKNIMDRDSKSSRKKKVTNDDTDYVPPEITKKKPGLQY